ncbi:hypothetical protein [Alteraurantiacibacter palmitatis]|uniref:Uncharacterized protein n=1 Tax=Alteraurantiacibacter palmitatis TaxID=2054628 RepID=A0ABV7E6F7_9SPHN
MTAGSFHPAIARRIRKDEALVRALKEIGADAGMMIMHAQREWASITFSGVRHSLTYAFDGAEAVAHAERMIALLPEHEFSLPGQLVADAAVTNIEHRIEPPRIVLDCELLVLDED